MRGWWRAFTGGERLPDAAGELYARALRRALDHDLEGAERLLAARVRRDSGDVDAYLALASLFRARGEVGRAIRIHQNILLREDLDEETQGEALAGLATDFGRGGFLRRAIAAWEELLARRPHSERATRALVRLLADARDFPRALELERRLARSTGMEARDRRRAQARLRVEWAAALHAEGRADDARRELRRAVRLDPESLEGWIHLGDLEAERGRVKAAVKAWRQGLALDRRAGPRIYPKLEATQAGRKRGGDHEAYLRGLVEAEPRDPGARLALARAQAARGQADEAATELRRVLEVDPEHLEARAALGRLLLEQRREPEALKAFGELLDVLERQGLLRAREQSE